MKIEKLSVSKLKFTLYHEDFLSWGLSPDTLSEDSPNTEALFQLLLLKAEVETGFEFDSDTVFVEATLTEDNTVEVLITKTDAPKGKVKYKVKNTGKAPIAQNAAFMFRFSDFENLCTFARVWESLCYTEIYEQNGEYFLFVQALPGESFAKLRFLISEFADAQDNPLLLRAQLSEHATLIAKGDAMAVIKKFFN